jgi:hypothetical protein
MNNTIKQPRVRRYHRVNFSLYILTSLFYFHDYGPFLPSKIIWFNCTIFTGEPGTAMFCYEHSIPSQALHVGGFSGQDLHGE